MSGSLVEANPYGRGNKTGNREGRGVLAAGVALARSTWRPKPHQRAVLVGDKGIDLVIGGIGSGKSTAAAHRLVRWALRYPRRRDGSPTKWLIAGPDFALLRAEQMELVLEAIRSLDVPFETLVRRVVYGADPRIYLAHGQVILARSGTEPRRMRGHQFDGGWLDEGEFMPEAAFTMSLARQRSAAAIRLVVTTSPQNVRGSWLWPLISGESKEHNALLEKIAVRVHRWASSANDANDAQVLAAIEAALEAQRPGTAAQELGGLFVGGEVKEAAVFDIDRAFLDPKTTHRLTAEDARAAVLGVDLGKSVDFTWLTVLGATGVVLAQERFNISTPGVSRDQFYPFVEQRILALADAYRVPVVRLDTAMHGASFAETLRRVAPGRIRIEGFRTDSPRRKAEALEALGVALSRAQVTVPTSWSGPDAQVHRVDHVEQLRRELVELVVEERGGTRTFDHPLGGHDDGIVALALAWQGLAMKGSRAGQMADLSKLLGSPTDPGRSVFGDRSGGYMFGGSGGTPS